MAEGTIFQEKAWAMMRKVPKGKVTTYKELANALGMPNASRAVGNACNANPNAPITPCHRVVSSNGRIGGYAHGVKRKIALLAKEGIRADAGGIIDFEKMLYKFK